VPSASLAARVFAAIAGLVCLFQLALALGAPWGRFAMGGAFPGTFPPVMRVAAIVQIAVLVGVALVVLSRADLVLPRWRAAARWLVWIVVALLAVGVTLNLITPSSGERMIWAPVAILMFLAALRVALGKPAAPAR
jgi:hypothetical protein